MYIAQSETNIAIQLMQSVNNFTSVFCGAINRQF